MIWMPNLYDFLSVIYVVKNWYSVVQKQAENLIGQSHFYSDLVIAVIHPLLLLIVKLLNLQKIQCVHYCFTNQDSI